MNDAVRELPRRALRLRRARVDDRRDPRGARDAPSPTSRSRFVLALLQECDLVKFAELDPLARRRASASSTPPSASFARPCRARVRRPRRRPRPASRRRRDRRRRAGARVLRARASAMTAWVRGLLVALATLAALVARLASTRCWRGAARRGCTRSGASRGLLPGARRSCRSVVWKDDPRRRIAASRASASRPSRRSLTGPRGWRSRSATCPACCAAPRSCSASSPLARPADVLRGENARGARHRHRHRARPVGIDARRDGRRRRTAAPISAARQRASARPASTWRRTSSPTSSSRRKTDRIGVVVFGRAAFVLSPPTLDYGLLTQLV